MRVSILAYGSRGDVQPFVALGAGLKRAGHTVQLAAPEPFETFVSRHGLDFAPLPGDPSQLVHGLVDRAGWNPLRLGREITRFALPLARQLQINARQACQGSDAIIHSFLMTIAGHEQARELGIPDFSAHAFPAFAGTAAFPQLLFPELPLGGRYNRLTHYAFTQSFWQLSRLSYNWFRRKNPEFPPLSGWPFDAKDRPAPPLMYAISPHVLPPPSDWGEHVHVTGYWFLDSDDDWQPSDDLLRFLDAGPPPVYIGFGSMITEDTQRLTEAIFGALEITGQRGLLLAGWGTLGDVSLPPNVFRIDSAPHDWLFPRMAAVVHHGGAGTTAAGLRAGVPTIIVPFTSDQPFWGKRVRALGVGTGAITRHKLTASRLAEAIQTATTNEEVQRKAAELDKRIRAENGIGRAIDIIQASMGT